MCNLCTTDPEEIKAVVAHHRNVAHRLRSMARNYEDMAAGRIKPHSEEMKSAGALGRNLIRELVEFI